MATAPFTLNVTVPGDTDIASQFPAVDRNNLDIINSWLKTDHNVNGTHNYSTYLQVDQADSGGHTVGAVVPANKNTAIFRDIDGALKTVRGDDSTVEFLGGVPPGTVVAYAGASLPTGWLWCDGGTFLRTARLFTAIGTTYGVGDGATTANTPDLNERVIIGRNRTGTSRINSGLTGSINTATLGGTGGEGAHTQIIAEIATHTHIQDAHQHSIPTVVTKDITASGGAGTTVWAISGSAPASTANTTATNQTTGSSQAANVVQPGIILNYIIRT